MKRRPQLASRSSELACRWKKSPSRRASNGWPRHSRRKIARPDTANTRGDRTTHQRRSKEQSDAIGRNDRAVGRAANGRRGAEVRNRPKDAIRLASFQRPQIAFDRPNLPFRSREEFRKLKLAHYCQETWFFGKRPLGSKTAMRWG